MNAFIAIALLTKLKLIFETDGGGEKQDQKFLAFQNGEFLVGKELFYFIDPEKYGVNLAEANVKRNEFAGLFNFVAEPADMITLLPDLLPDLYQRVLKKAIPANSHRTPEQEEQYQKAVEFLNREEVIDGVALTPLAIYEQYEQLYKTAVSEYKLRQVQAVMAEGVGAEEIKAQWTADEPSLKNAISRALLLWETKGRKNEVEKWLGLFHKLAGASPVTLLGELQTDFDVFAKKSGADVLASEFSYLPTLFNPSNFFEDQVSWPQLSLDKMEVASLYEKAPESLRKLFQKNENDPAIKKISFEYAVVSIVRDWFPLKDFFLQRFWKLPGDQPPVSDGEGNGLIPSFPEKLIFVRNVVISYETPVQPTAVKNLSAELFHQLDPQVKTRLKAKSASFLDRRLKFRTAAVTTAASTATSTAVSTAMTTGASSGGATAPTAGSGTATTASASTVKPIATRRLNAMLFKSIDIKKFPDIVTKPPVPKPPPPPTPSGVTEIKSPAMELLAFICRKMPLCPDPDPDLDWS